MATTVQQCPTENWCQEGDTVHTWHRATEYLDYDAIPDRAPVQVDVIAKTDGPRMVEVTVPGAVPLANAHRLGLALHRVNTSYND